MKSAARYPILIGLFTTVLIGSLGCAANRPYALALPPPPPEEVKAQLVTIGVVSKGFPQKLVYSTPAADAADGAAEGARYGLSMVWPPPPDAGIIFYPIFYPAVLAVTLAAGAVVGAVIMPPAAEVDQAEVALTQAWADLNVTEAMRDRLVQATRGYTRYIFVPIPEPNPAASGEQPNYYSRDRDRYYSLAREGVDTILEISGGTISLAAGERAGRINPSLMLLTTVRARLLRSVDSTVLYAYTAEYRGATHTFTEWGANNAQMFCDEINRGYHRLAADIVDQVFGTAASPRIALKAP